VKKKNVILVLIILLLATAVLCGFLFVRAYVTAREEMSEYSDVQREYTSVVSAPVPATSDDHGEDPGNDHAPAATDGLPYVTADFDALLLENPDTVGWLAIPDTVISYPIVQASDNAKYLNVSFLGKRSSAGTPFADSANNMRDLDANTVLYGHNMGFGRKDMFGSLLSYKDKDFYEAHRYIQFDTIYQRYGWWKVFAVIEHDIRSEAKEPSLYDSDTEISPDDLVLTLSTCDRSKYGKNGRLLVLAVKMSSFLH